MQKWLTEKGEQLEEKIKAELEETTPEVQDKEQLADSEYSEEEEDDVFEEIPKLAIIEKNKFKPGRVSVSAEAYGQFNQRSLFQAKVVTKSTGQKIRIKNRLSNSFMFSSLDEKEKNIVIDAMEEKNFEPGDYLIRQGDAGDELFVVDSGKLSCYKKLAPGMEDKFLKHYNPGESFGELALLYNCPRAASIKADDYCTVFSLDRATFNNIVKDAAMKKREKYEEFLGKIQLLSTLDPYERSKLAEVLKPMTFKKGDYVMKQGDSGDTFYFIEEGTCVATKNKPGKPMTSNRQLD